MPTVYSCERILAGVDWAHAELCAMNKASGYAMDELLKEYQSGDPRPGKFARYLRGENLPSERVLMELMSAHRSDASERMQLPLYDVLARGHHALLDSDADIDVLFEIERRLTYRLTRHWSGNGLEAVEITPARASTLASHANSYALTALLVWAPSRQALDSDGGSVDSNACLLIGQRAFQCLILTMASGEFAQTGPVLTARVRQRVLDGLEWQGQQLDTASVDVAAAVEAGRRLLEQTRTQTTPSKQRSALRKLLTQDNAADLAAITPKIVPVEHAQAMRAKHPVALAFPPTPGAKANRVSGYGLKARALLLKELAGYVQDL